MPLGWDSSLGGDRQRVTVILTISLVLSVVICFFISGFLIWRRKRGVSVRDGDEEIKLTRRTTSLTVEEANNEQQAKVRQKFWARQSARWKMNIRASARRRKNRRLLAIAHHTALAHSSAVSLQDGPTLSRPPSISTIRSRNSSSTRNTTTQDDSTSTAPPPPTHVDPGPSSPPAYIPGDLPSLPNPDTKHPRLFESEEDSSASRSRNEHTYTSAVENENDDLIPYEEHQYQQPHRYPHTTGHLATDDKNVLSQMTWMASAPEDDESSSHAASASVSAPVWHDETLEEALNASREPPSTSLPPPPSKGTPQFYEDPYSFEEDVHTIEPSYEPSAPPFEEHATTPSAPPLDMMPSAPPFLEDVIASAPPVASTDSDEEHVGQGHDRLGRGLDLPSYRV